MRLAFHNGSSYIPPRLNGVGVSGLSDCSNPDSNGNCPSLSTQITGSLISGASTGAQVAIALGGTTKANIIGGIAAGLIASAPIPVVGPILAGIGAVMGPIAVMFKGCGQTCIQSSNFANQASSALDQLRAQYFAQPVHYESVQQATMQAVENILNWLNQACGSPALGPAGQKCISERLVRGGTAPWCPNPGNTGCDYWTTYYDPVAHDTSVVPDPASSNVSVNPVTGQVTDISSSKFPVPLMIGGATVLVLLLAGSN